MQQLRRRVTSLCASKYISVTINIIHLLHRIQTNDLVGGKIPKNLLRTVVPQQPVLVLCSPGAAVLVRPVVLTLVLHRLPLQLSPRPPAFTGSISTPPAACHRAPSNRCVWFRSGSSPETAPSPAPTVARHPTTVRTRPPAPCDEASPCRHTSVPRWTGISGRFIFLIMEGNTVTRCFFFNYGGKYPDENVMEE